MGPDQSKHLFTIQSDYCKMGLHLWRKIISCLKIMFLVVLSLSLLRSGYIYKTRRDMYVSVPLKNSDLAEGHHFRHWGKTTQTPCQQRDKDMGEYQWGQRKKSAGCQTQRSPLWTYRWMHWTAQSYLKGNNADTQTDGNRQHRYEWVWILQ